MNQSSRANEDDKKYPNKDTVYISNWPYFWHDKFLITDHLLTCDFMTPKCEIMKGKNKF